MPMLMQDAITWDAEEIIQILASHGADVNGIDDSNDYFLERAVRLGSVKATRALLDSGADWRLKSSEPGDNIAVESAWRDPAIVKLFLEKGADANAVSDAGHTMLMSAVSMENLAAVKFLVDSGADVNVRNKPGETALSVARQQQKQYRNTAAESAQSFQPIIDYLLAHGSVP
jgi:ankyrin repeat protein